MEAVFEQKEVRLVPRAIVSGESRVWSGRFRTVAESDSVRGATEAGGGGSASRVVRRTRLHS